MIGSPQKQCVSCRDFPAKASRRFYCGECGHGCQFEAGFAGEFGVGLHDFDREADLICNSRARAVPPGAQLKITDIIIRSVSVEMMHRFTGKQSALQFLLHHIPVLKDLFGSRVWVATNRKTHVAVTRRVCDRLSIGVIGEHLLALQGASALGTAHHGSSTNITVTPMQRLAAVLAGLVANSAPAKATAGRRTVERIATEFGAIACQFARVARKGAAALFALEVNGLDPFARAAHHFSCSVAGRAAVFSSPASLLVRGREALLAMRAGETGWHRYLKVSVRFDTYGEGSRLSTAFVGVA